ncbi:hypothetical protein QFZ79_004115 [Arthrobacter sp. V4I6]|nr:hypothetical protein [Arthrobacter sp. V1I7]MDQ0856004.1 hypothetical protein [Arthrobacter sp. V4I6]
MGDRHRQGIAGAFPLEERRPGIYGLDGSWPLVLEPFQKRCVRWLASACTSPSECTTSTGQSACETQAELTDPRCMPRKPPWPRRPTTSSAAPAPAERTRQARTGTPHRTHQRLWRQCPLLRRRRHCWLHHRDRIKAPTARTRCRGSRSHGPEICPAAHTPIFSPLKRRRHAGSAAEPGPVMLLVAVNGLVGGTVDRNGPCCRCSPGRSSTSAYTRSR